MAPPGRGRRQAARSTLGKVSSGGDLLFCTNNGVFALQAREFNHPH